MLATTAVAEPATTTATAAAATAFAAHSNPSIKPISVPPTFIPAFLSPLWGFPGFRFVIKYIQASYRNDPFRSFLELCLIVFVIWWTSRSKYKQGRNEVQLTEEEIDELVDDWKPEPLVPKLTECQRMSIAKIPTIEGPNGVNVRVAGRSGTAINFASYNHLGLAFSEETREAAVGVLRQYGVGSCGPPGFYGTLDVHIDLEKRIAEFIGAETAILYSQGMSTVLSVIPCFSKRSDVIVADEAVNFAVQQAIILSRSKVFWYKHNDMQDLERVLGEVNRIVKKRKGPLCRKFIVTEGLFQNTGHVALLPEILKLKDEYKYRIIVDESYSFGVLGKRGAGITDHFGIPPSRIDLIIGSLCNAVGVAGGFCCAHKDLTGHQRLSGLGYCYSASMPAILAVIARNIIDALDEDSERLISPLRRNTKLAHDLLSKVPDIIVDGDQLSPIIHISIAPTALTKKKSTGEWTRGDFELALQEVVDEALKNGILLTRAHYVYEHEHLLPNPSIRLCVSTLHSEKDIAKCVKIIGSAVNRVTKRK